MARCCKTSLARTRSQEVDDLLDLLPEQHSPLALLAADPLSGLLVGPLPHLDALQMRAVESLPPRGVESRQRPAPPVRGRLARHLPHVLEVLLEIGIQGREGHAVALARDAIRLPLLLDGEGRQRDAAGEEAAGEHGLPLEDLEGEAGGDGADEAERGVLLPEDVLVEVREAVVADARGQFGEKVEGPGVSAGSLKIGATQGGGAVGERRCC